MAWGRILNLIIGDKNNAFVISDLDIEFEIERSITLSENNAHFVVYNAKEETRKEVLKKGNSIVFEVGYDDEGVSTIFAGNITESNSKKENMDWVTEIKAVAGRGANIDLDQIDIGISYSAGALASKPLQDIGALLGLVVNGIRNADIILPNGWVYVGSANGALRYLKDILSSSGVSLYIDNNELVVHLTGEPSKFNIAILSYTGGLLYVQDLEEVNKESGASRNKKNDTRKRLKFKSIIIPQIQINGPVVFRTQTINVTYIVEKLKYVGNNYGANDFTIEGEVVER